MIVLGIDPGTATTGYGVIEIEKGHLNQWDIKKSLKCLDFGCIKTKPNLRAEERLKRIYSEIGKLIKKHKPDIMSVESVYFFKNLKTAMPVSQVKGVILLAAAQKKLPIYEVAPLEVKMNIVGYGRAEKKQTQKMVELLLNLDSPIKSDDAADALGVAICGALKSFR